MTDDIRNEEMNEEEFMEAVDGTWVDIHQGDVLTGEVIYVTPEEVMVSLGGGGADGIINIEELSVDGKAKPKDLYKEKDKIDVYVLRLDDGDGNIVLSTRRLEAIKKWEELEEVYENDEIIKVHVNSDRKGGLTVTVNDLDGFMPASHVSTRYVDDLSVYAGKDLDAKIIDLEKGKPGQGDRIIVSAKKVEQEKEAEQKEKIWSALEKGEIREGKVARIVPFGAFIDLGGVDGLAHISDLSWNRINDPKEVLSEGDTVEVKILDFDKEKNRISLGYKQTQEKPWDIFVANNSAGDIVEGVVVNVLDFGVFVRLEEGVDGLVHVSQISEEHVRKPADILVRGDKIEVKILEIDSESEKISLSIKEAKREEQISKPEEASNEEIEESINTEIADQLGAIKVEDEE